MTLIEKFDAVLKALYDISGKRPTFGRIMALLRVQKQDIHWAEVWDIMGKMRRDYLIHPEITDRTSKIPTEVIHLITFEGKLMYERKGLGGKIGREKSTNRRVGFLEWTTFLLAIGTVYFASGGVNDSTLKQTNELIKQARQPPDSDSQLKEKIATGTYPDRRTLSRQLNYDTISKKFFYLDTFYIGIDTIYTKN